LRALPINSEREYYHDRRIEAERTKLASLPVDRFEAHIAAVLERISNSVSSSARVSTAYPDIEGSELDLILRRASGYSQRDIAAQRGCSQSTISRKLGRIMSRHPEWDFRKEKQKKPSRARSWYNLPDLREFKGSCEEGIALVDAEITRSSERFENRTILTADLDKHHPIRRQRGGKVWTSEASEDSNEDPSAMLSWMQTKSPSWVRCGPVIPSIKPKRSGDELLWRFWRGRLYEDNPDNEAKAEVKLRLKCGCYSCRRWLEQSLPLPIHMRPWNNIVLRLANIRKSAPDYVVDRDALLNAGIKLSWENDCKGALDRRSGQNNFTLRLEILNHHIALGLVRPPVLRPAFGPERALRGKYEPVRRSHVRRKRKTKRQVRERQQLRGIWNHQCSKQKEREEYAQAILERVDAREEAIREHEVEEHRRRKKSKQVRK